MSENRRLAALLHDDPALCRKHSPHGHPRWMQSPLCVSVAARLIAQGVRVPTEAGDDDDSVPPEVAAYFDGRDAAIRDVVAHRASPPEYPGLALVPLAEIERLAVYAVPLRAALAAPPAPALDREREP